MGIGAVILERGAVERVVGEGGELGVLGGWVGEGWRSGRRGDGF